MHLKRRPALRQSGTGAARRRVGWNEALDKVAKRFADIISEHGPDSVAFYISGQLLTEDYHVFNKLAKGLIGTNNVDTNSRLCMSSAVAGYKQTLGADAPPACYEDLDLADTVLIAGSNMAYAHPVLFRRLEDSRAVRPQMKIIVVDPRRTDTAAFADLHLPILPGTDIALFNAMLHVLMWEGLIDSAFIREHTEGFDALKQAAREYTPAMVAQICGVPEADIVKAAKWFGEAGAESVCLSGETAAEVWLKNMMLAGASAEAYRPWILAPVSKPPQGSLNRGRIVCVCVDVSESEINETLRGGADYAGLQSRLKCGTECGSCVPGIKRLCAAQDMRGKARTSAGFPA